MNIVGFAILEKENKLIQPNGQHLQNTNFSFSEYFLPFQIQYYFLVTQRKQYIKQGSTRDTYLIKKCSKPMKRYTSSSSISNIITLWINIKTQLLPYTAITIASSSCIPYGSNRDKIELQIDLYLYLIIIMFTDQS